MKEDNLYFNQKKELCFYDVPFFRTHSLKMAKNVSLPKSPIDFHVMYSARIVHAHAYIMHHVFAHCSQVSNKKIRLRIRSGIHEISTIMFIQNVNKQAAMFERWGWYEG